MKHLLLPALLALTVPFAVTAQPVTNVDVPQLLAALPAFAATPAEAYQRAYTQNPPRHVGAEVFYQPWQNRLQEIATALQRQQIQFYQQYPTGIRPTAPTSSRVSAGDQTAMNNAVAEFAQKMQSDPAFAQAFSQKSEAEQQAYMQQLLAKNGLQAAAGQPNRPQPDQDPINWAELTTALNTEWATYLPGQSVAALLAKAEEQHTAINQQANAEGEKIPLIEMGEYGHDHDPKLVEALRQRTLTQHRAVAANTLREGKLLLEQNQAHFVQVTADYRAALQQVKFGEGYDFGIFYSQVLGQQSWLLMQLNQLGQDAAQLTDHVAYWEAQK